MDMTINSEAFGQGRPIPRKYSQDGRNVSPPLGWSGVPGQAKELALVVDDPDAPTEKPWVHWVMYKIPAGTAGLAEGIAASPTPAAPAGAMQGLNTSGNMGYDGPAPPRGHGVHHYHFKIYALDTELDLQPGLDKEALLEAMRGHVLAKGELIGTYER